MQLFEDVAHFNLLAFLICDWAEVRRPLCVANSAQHKWRRIVAAENLQPEAHDRLNHLPGTIHVAPRGSLVAVGQVPDHGQAHADLTAHFNRA